METAKLLRIVQDPSGYHLTITNHLVIHFDTLTYTFRFYILKTICQNDITTPQNVH